MQGQAGGGGAACGEKRHGRERWQLETVSRCAHLLRALARSIFWILEILKFLSQKSVLKTR